MRNATVIPSVYDAPEIASGNISSASDSWSLGMTLMEALTQRLPAHEAVAEPVLETVPAPFMGIAHCCLRRDPQRRCSAADIAERLRRARLHLIESYIPGTGAVYAQNSRRIGEVALHSSDCCPVADRCGSDYRTEVAEAGFQ